MASETTGSCLCGACAYSYTGEPALRSLRRHQHLNFAIPEDKFTVTKGQTKSYSAEHEYGMTLTIFFCPDCGSTLWKEATAEHFKGLKLAQGGTLNDAKNLDTTINAEFYAPERASYLTPIKNATQSKDF
ncbi:hypothetical protein CEP53_003246 [Fusarium sp. AF-6]|nr:hypothetical protein CEP53_003246 [Fusarium sp. AF-6]